MANKLNIYACTGIGDTEDPQGGYTFWTNGTNPVDNTQAQNTLLSLINTLNVEVLYLKGLTDTEKIARLNEISLYGYCLNVVTNYRKDGKMMQSAGYAIAHMIDEGKFNCDSLDNAVRKEFNTRLLEEKVDADDMMRYGEANPNFVEWWNEVIIPRNKVGFTQEQRNTVRRAEKQLSSGISGNDNWVNDTNISNYLLNAALYFTYYYLTEEQLSKLPKIFRRKHNVQAKTYYMCSGYFVGVYGGVAEMDNIIRSGIIKEYGYTPEEVCASIVAGDNKVKPVNGNGGVHEVAAAVTMTAAEIASIIVAAITAVATIIVTIIECVKTCVSAKYQAVTAEQAAKGCPDPSDYDDINWDDGGWNKDAISAVTDKWLPIAAIGVAIMLLLKANN